MEFITENGIGIPAISAEQMKEIDRIAIEETGPNLFQMMENAGRILTELTIRVLDKNFDQEIIVLAGKGGNGGGGICAARHLANRGYNVKVCISEPQKLKEVTNYQLHILKSTSAQIISIEELQNEKPDLIIDAIIGYSLKGEPEGKELELIKWANEQLTKKISLDVPSGVNATTGETFKHFIKPDLTLTLALPKTGFLPELTGELYLGDIGITKATIERVIPGIDSIIFRDDYLVRMEYQIKQNELMSKY
jgi:NAD(P)H-hydrate epimerase